MHTQRLSWAKCSIRIRTIIETMIIASMLALIRRSYRRPLGLHWRPSSSINWTMNSSCRMFSKMITTYSVHTATAIFKLKIWHIWLNWITCQLWETKINSLTIVRAKINPGLDLKCQISAQSNQSLAVEEAIGACQEPRHQIRLHHPRLFEISRTRQTKCPQHIRECSRMKQGNGISNWIRIKIFLNPYLIRGSKIRKADA